jgi:hypothetical protein
MTEGVLRPYFDQFMPAEWAFRTFKGNAGAVGPTHTLLAFCCCAFSSLTCPSPPYTQTHTYAHTHTHERSHAMHKVWNIAVGW